LRLGVRFGIGFTIRGGPAGTPTTVRRVWHFPPMTNPQTGETSSSTDYTFRCTLNEPCFTGQVLSQDFELVAGTWSVDVWVGSTQVITHSFELFQP
jgi:hypothetical protein